MTARPVKTKIVDLDDVSAASPADGDLLSFDSATSKWKKQSGGSIPVLDVATQYGSTAAAINQAISDAHDHYVAGNGRVVVYLAAGTWSLGDVIVPKDYVTLTGAGRDKTILKPSGTNPGLQYIGSTSAYLTDFELADLTIDGSNQSGTYAYTIKGVYFQYVSGCAFRRLNIVNCYATGLGLDYPKSGTIVQNCQLNSNGRGNTGSGGGGNGMGCLIGAQDNEDCLIDGCTANSNKQFGFIIEKLSTDTGKGAGYRFVGCYAALNSLAGFGDGGAYGAVFSGCWAYKNHNGFLIGDGDNQGSGGSTYHPGQYGLIIGCLVDHNTAEGILFDCTTHSQAGPGYTVADCHVLFNGSSGIKGSVASVGNIDKLTIKGCQIRSNGGGSNAGISIASSGTSTFTDLVIVNNEISDNNANGILISASVSGGRIEGNRCSDSGSSVQTTGISLASGKTLTSVVFGGGSIDGTVTLSATLTSCTVGLITGWTRVSGAPALKAPKGTLAQRSDGSSGTLLYVNTDGGTTWSAFA